MARAPRVDPIKDVEPTSFPQVSPRQAAQGSHDFTLQAVMEMKATLGDLCGKTERLIADVEKQGTKLDKVRLQIAWVAGGAAAIGFIFATLLAVSIAIIRFLPTMPR